MPQSNQPSAFNYAVTSRAVDVEEFTTSGQWVKPSNANFVIVELWGGGGGAGSNLYLAVNFGGF